MRYDEHQLKLEIIWKDDDMVELRAFASNGRYCGTTEVYTTAQELIELATRVEGFPKKVDDVVEFRAGAKQGYAFLDLIFNCVDGSGHTALLVSMEENVPTFHRPAEKHEVRLELRCEPGSIDQFQKDLLEMGATRTGSASLHRQMQDGRKLELT
jgi:hypothetical protein